jgi:hypothetical protein
MVRSQPSVTSSSSVAAGPVRHSMAFTLRAAVRASARMPASGPADAEVGEEAGMIPVRGVRQDQAVEVREDAVHGLAVAGASAGS